MFDVIDPTASRKPGMMAPTEEAVRRRFSYRDGNLYYAHDVFRAKRGDPAFWPTAGGRKCVYFDGRNYAQARLVWLWHHGTLPEAVARRDGDRMNDDIDNLIEIRRPHEALTYMQGHGRQPTEDVAEPAAMHAGLADQPSQLARTLEGASCALVKNGDLWSVFDHDFQLLGRYYTVAECHAVACHSGLRLTCGDHARG